jgi:hypothetical protein
MYRLEYLIACIHSKAETVFTVMKKMEPKTKWRAFERKIMLVRVFKREETEQKKIQRLYQ